MKKMQAEIERHQKEMLEAQDTIKKLEEQLRLVQAAKEEYEIKQKELQEMMVRLENEKHLEVDAKTKLEEEIKNKAEEVEVIKKVVEEKDHETRKLQEEVEEVRRRQQEAAAALIAVSSTPEHHYVQDYEHDEQDDETVDVQTGDLNHSGSNEHIPRPEEERNTELSKKKVLNDQLQTLSAELDLAREKDKLTTNDLLHQDNVKKGRDKYKTLREIRKGNTKRRVDQFENM